MAQKPTHAKRPGYQWSLAQVLIQRPRGFIIWWISFGARFLLEFSIALDPFIYEHKTTSINTWTYNILLYYFRSTVPTLILEVILIFNLVVIALIIYFPEFFPDICKKPFVFKYIWIYMENIDILALYITYYFSRYFICKNQDQGNVISIGSLKSDTASQDINSKVGYLAKNYSVVVIEDGVECYSANHILIQGFFLLSLPILILLFINYLKIEYLHPDQTKFYIVRHATPYFHTFMVSLASVSAVIIRAFAHDFHSRVGSYSLLCIVVYLLSCIYYRTHPSYFNVLPEFALHMKSIFLILYLIYMCPYLWHPSHHITSIYVFFSVLLVTLISRPLYHSLQSSLEDSPTNRIFNLLNAIHPYLHTGTTSPFSTSPRGLLAYQELQRLQVFIDGYSGKNILRYETKDKKSKGDSSDRAKVRKGKVRDATRLSVVKESKDEASEASRNKLSNDSPKYKEVIQPSDKFFPPLPLQNEDNNFEKKISINDQPGIVAVMPIKGDEPTNRKEENNNYGSTRSIGNRSMGTSNSLNLVQPEMTLSAKPEADKDSLKLLALPRNRFIEEVLKSKSTYLQIIYQALMLQISSLKHSSSRSIINEDRACLNLPLCIYFCTYYLFSPTLAIYILRQFSQNNTLQEPIKSILDQLIENSTKHSMDNPLTDNLKSKNIARCSEKTNRQSPGPFRFSHVVMYINYFEEVKTLLSKILVVKKQFMETLDYKGTVMLDQIFTLATSFTELDKRICTVFKRLQSIFPLHSPAQILYGNYLDTIVQDKKAAIKILNACSQRKFNADYSSLGNLLTGDASIIGVSLERDNFHKINLVTSGVSKYMDWSMEELNGSDLNILIPWPVRQVHKTLCNLRRITGERFSGIAANLIIKMKANLVRKVQLKLCLNFRLTSGIQVLGNIVFTKNVNEDAFFVISKEGFIKEVDEGCHTDFKKGAHLDTYSPGLFQRIISLSSIVARVQKEGYPSISQLQADDNLFAEYYSYVSLRQGEIHHVNFQTPEGGIEPLLVLCKVNFYYINQTSSVMRTVTISKRIPAHSEAYRSYPYVDCREVPDAIVGESNVIYNMVVWSIEKESEAEGPEERSKKQRSSPQLFDTAVETQQFMTPILMAVKSRRKTQFQPTPTHKHQGSMILVGQTEASFNRPAISNGITSLSAIPIRENLPIRSRTDKQLNIEGASNNGSSTPTSCHVEGIRNAGREVIELAKIDRKIQILLNKIVKRGRIEKRFLGGDIAMYAILLIFVLYFASQVVSVSLKRLVYLSTVDELRIKFPLVDASSWYLFWLEPFLLYEFQEMYDKGMTSQDYMQDWKSNYTYTGYIDTFISLMSPFNFNVDSSIRISFMKQIRPQYSRYQEVIDHFKVSNTMLVPVLKNSDQFTMDMNNNFVYKEFKNSDAIRYSDEIIKRAIADFHSTQSIPIYSQLPLPKTVIGYIPVTTFHKNLLRRVLLGNLVDYVYRMQDVVNGYTEGISALAISGGFYVLIYTLVSAAIVTISSFLFIFLSNRNLLSFYRKLFYLRRSEVTEQAALVDRLAAHWKQLIYGNLYLSFLNGYMKFDGGGHGSLSSEKAIAVGSATHSPRKEARNRFFAPVSNKLGKNREPNVMNSPVKLYGNRAANSLDYDRTRKLNQGTERITISSTSGFGTGLYKKLWLVAAIILTILLLNIQDYLSLNSEAQILANYVKVSAINAELWNHAQLVRTLLNEAVLHPGEVECMGKPALQVVKESNEYIKNVAIPGLIALIDQPLGDYGPTYKYLMTNYSLCEEMVANPIDPTRLKYTLDGCGTGASSYLSNNIILVLKSLTSLIDEFHTELSELVRQGNLEECKRMLNRPKFKAFFIFSFSDGINSNIYYSILLPLIKNVQVIIAANTGDTSAATENAESSSGSTFSRLMKNSRPAKLYFGLSLVILVVGLLAVYYFFLLKVLRTFRIFRNTCLLVPWTMTLNNPLLSHHFNE